MEEDNNRRENYLSDSKGKSNVQYSKCQSNFDNIKHNNAENYSLENK